MVLDGVGDGCGKIVEARRSVSVEHSVENRQNDQREQRRGDDAADDHSGQRALDFGARAGSQSHRHDYKGLIPTRDNDILGVGIGYAQLTNGAKDVAT
jgi:hypothetical protein